MAWNAMLFDRAWIFAAAGSAAAAAIVAALALMVSWVVRGRPAPLRYGLLLAALAVLGAVPAVAVASRLIDWAAVQVPAAIVDRPLATAAAGAAPMPARPPRTPTVAADAEIVPPEPSVEIAASPLRMPTFREAASCLLWVWLAGLVFCVTIVIRDVIRLRRLGRSLVPCSSQATIGLLREAARAVGLKQPPRLVESAAVPVPVVIGPINPVIVLPTGMAHALDREKLAAVLTHETAHVIHGDLWVGLLQHAVAAAFWWCPAVHRLNRRLAEVREEICDDYVVAAQGDGFQLAEVLVEMAAGLRGKRGRLAVGTLGAIDEKPALEGRVERLVDVTRKTAPVTRMNRLAVVVAGAFGAVALAIVLATTIDAADEPVVAHAPVQEAAAPATPPVEMTADELRALDAALAWIAKQQEDDGSWSLGGPGDRPMRAAATSLAILPFLSRGHDHKAPGPYRERMARGIEFLVALVGEDGRALRDGESMYSQGLVAMTLARAFGRTRDPALKPSTRAALDFIVAAQDPAGGGWRYVPKQPGDTSALGFQIEALACGQAAGLDVNPETWAGVARFLDGVQDDGGSVYGYKAPGKGRTTTAIGLLGRLRSGWEGDHAALVKGVARLAGQGPSDDVFFDFHASRLLHAAADADTYGAWRTTMNERLLERQVAEGKDSGSWHDGFKSWIGSPRARQFCTCFAAQILAEPLESTRVPPRGHNDDFVK